MITTKSNALICYDIIKVWNETEGIANQMHPKRSAYISPITPIYLQYNVNTA